GKPADVLIQRPAFYIFHAVEGAAVGERAGIVGGNNPRILKACQHRGFMKMSRGEIGRTSFRGKNFQRHRPAEHGIFRQPDRTHSPTAKLTDRAVSGGGEVGSLHLCAESGNGLVRQEFHFASAPNLASALTPKSDCASRRNSSSLPVISCSCSSTQRR